MKNLLLLCVVLGLSYCTKEDTKTNVQKFAEFASVQVKGKTGNFRGENTLAYTLRVASPSLCLFLPLQVAIPLAVDTSQAKLKYIVQHTDKIYFYSYTENRKLAKGILDYNRDTILNQLVLQGQDVIQYDPNGYRLETFGKGAFNSTLRQWRVGTDIYDTIGYIPSRVTARFYLLVTRLFSEGKYDSCEYYMHNMIKFYPLDNPKQYRDLIASGQEPVFTDTTQIRQYLEVVKREDAGMYPF